MDKCRHTYLAPRRGQSYIYADTDTCMQTDLSGNMYAVTDTCMQTHLSGYMYADIPIRRLVGVKAHIDEIYFLVSRYVPVSSMHSPRTYMYVNMYIYVSARVHLSKQMEYKCSMYLSMYVYIHTYINTERQRERDRERSRSYI